MLKYSMIIHSIAAKDFISFKSHSLLRMRQRCISSDDVKQALLNGRIIEFYPDDRPMPSCLILGQARDGRLIHSVVAYDIEEQMLWLITVYEPDPLEWAEGFDVRRKK